MNRRRLRLVLGIAIMGIFVTSCGIDGNNVQNSEGNSQVKSVEDQEKTQMLPEENKLGTVTVLTAEEAYQRMESGDPIVIVDVRTEEEYNTGHIEGAILIPNETILDTKPELLPDEDAEILIYCRSGNRSAKAAKKLAALGYTNIYDFGGIIDWPYEISE